MANTSSMLSIGQYYDICPEDITTNCTNVSVSNIEISCPDSKNSEELQCFVCDAKIQGRHYALATCRTQTSRSRVIEKLGELVGERYMVVISEDDVICRSCANLINTLDRLESEMCNLRDNVLRFLEQKYSLEKGELLGNNEKQKRSQPPQITKCNNQIATSCQGKKRDITLSSHINEKTKNKKNNVWLQCDKCQYTTPHNSFVAHHNRDQIKQKIFCDKCGVYFFENKQDLHNCNLKEHSNEQTGIEDEQAESSMKDLSDTIMNIPILDKTMQQNVPLMTIQTYSESQIPNHSNSIPIIRLSNSDNLPIQHILTSDSTPATGQSIYVRVLQPVEINESSNSAIMTMPNSDTDIAIKLKDNSGKQILTLTEDGNLEMTEVTCWNDLQSSEPQSNITFNNLN
ncbi:uncharacterized protein LOC143176989 [Calliopsis andreniformis]|uniref:uncharacterized protein LOC143176989 n=1 Tax=Calliopsis andreniformis TaxID=337506 RepID=UPI003FCE7E3A